jgi:dTDP-4-dehydrorhamnose 3,5-epimerase
MKFVETELKGAFIIEPDRLEDERGFFARVFCEEEFAAHGLETHFVQCSISFNHRKGTLRGMHYQAPPHEETKIVRCSGGLIYDVIVDLREDSGTYRKWVGIELSATNHRMVYVPAGFAHGFQTLEDNCEVHYQISVEYNPASSRGLHYADHELAIAWPLPVKVISERDRSFPSTRSVLLSKA